MTLRRGRLLALGAGLALAAFTVVAGEYSTRDWLRLKRELAAERARIQELKAEVDSLAKLADALATNPVVQERMAREEFGMIREGELLYRIVPADTGRR